jgi:histidine triad (HIT) family protein
MENCVFCKIISGEFDSYKVWEDDEFLAFLSKPQDMSGHVLVVPKRHIDYFWNMEDEEFARLNAVGKMIAKKMVEGLGCGLATFKYIGEDIAHTHLHITPTSCKNIKKTDYITIQKTLNELLVNDGEKLLP